VTRKDFIVLISFETTAAAAAAELLVIVASFLTVLSSSPCLRSSLIVAML
jgi:hypothetical protein